MNNKRTLSVCFAGIGMMALILDASSALYGASEGIDLCVRTVIPSMFPFLVLSIFLTGQMFSLRLRWLRPLGRLLHLPENAEVIFLVGLLGGYPMGAQCIRQAYDTGGLSRPDAQRMLCFCSNAGPAFFVWHWCPASWKCAPVLDGLGCPYSVCDFDRNVCPRGKIPARYHTGRPKPISNGCCPSSCRRDGRHLQLDRVVSYSALIFR